MINLLLAGFIFTLPTFPVKPALPPTPIFGQPSASPSATPIPSTTPSVLPSPSPSASPPTTKPSLKPSPSVVSGFTVESILKGLNDYRAKNNTGSLVLDDKLQSFAQTRANALKNLGKLDGHAGYKLFIQNDGFNKLGFGALAENQNYNSKGTAQNLIENVFGKSSGHNKNQLNPVYTHVGIGINGPFTNIVFGGKKK